MTTDSLQFLERLEAVIEERLATAPEDSYTARLAAAGAARLAQKVGEEGVELAIAGALQNPDEITNEAADLVYHLLVLLQVSGKRLVDVVDVLEGRHAG